MGRAVKSRNVPVEFEPHSNRALYMISDALGQKDSYTQAHAQRVAAYAERLAQRMGMPDRQIRQVVMGGMLHDVGKLALSDRIFSSKQAALSDELLGEVQSHPLIGAALLNNVACDAAIVEVVLYHHERMDGSGYPFGLQADQIPISAMLVSVADCFDAITTDRPYQRRKSRAHAFAILKQMAGIALPQDMVALMIEEIQANGMEPIMTIIPSRTPLAHWALQG